MPVTGRFFSGPKDRLDRPRILMVEGQDDAFFLDVILEQLAASPATVGVIYVEGKDRMAPNIADLVKSREFATGNVERFGVIVDSDDDPGETLKIIHAALTKFNQPTPDHGQLSAPDGRPRVGIFLIPAGDQGNLEKLCLDTLDAEDRLRLVQDFLAEIEKRFGQLNSRYKRLAQIYLACHKVRARGVGRAFQLGVFNRDHKALNPLRDFLQKFIA